MLKKVISESYPDYKNKPQTGYKFDPYYSRIEEKLRIGSFYELLK